MSRDTQEATLLLRVPGMLRGRYQGHQKCIRNKAAHVGHAWQSTLGTGAIFKRKKPRPRVTTHLPQRSVFCASVSIIRSQRQGLEPTLLPGLQNEDNSGTYLQVAVATTWSSIHSVSDTGAGSWQVSDKVLARGYFSRVPRAAWD